MKCPECNGWGFIPVIMSGREVICPICDGNKILPANLFYGPGAGEELKKIRIFLERTLRQDAEYRGVDPIDLAMIEKGYFKKDAENENNFDWFNPIWKIIQRTL